MPLLLTDCLPQIVIISILAVGLVRSRGRFFYRINLDQIAAIIGLLLGLFITLLNFIYSNHYLKTLGPILAILCAAYLVIRKRVLEGDVEPDPSEAIVSAGSRTGTIFRILFWIFLAGGIIVYYLAPVYTRPPLFFIFISLCVTMLALEIVTLANSSRSYRRSAILIKIFLSSILIRASAYFISGYPVGADPWAHAEYIRNYLTFGSLQVISYPPGTGVSNEYIQYPLMHLYTVITVLVGNLGVHPAMFVTGAALVFSTLFVFLIVRMLTQRSDIALLSVLLINFADFHIQWSVQVIAMTFGLILFTFILYLIVRNWKKEQAAFRFFLILFISMIIWTHTVTAFIALTDLLVLLIASVAYSVLYEDRARRSFKIESIIFLFFILMLTFKWVDPSYPFIEGVWNGLMHSLEMEAEFLGRTESVFGVERTLNKIFDISGMLVYIAIGILGSLYVLSRKMIRFTSFSLIVAMCALFFVYFAFPLFGIRNIMPDRWPAFIYLILVIFIPLGFMVLSRIVGNQRTVLLIFGTIFFVSSFFMTTNYVTNTDSPIYNTQITEEVFSRSSDVFLLHDIRNVTDRQIIADSTTNRGLLRSYLRDWNCVSVPLTRSREISWDAMTNANIIWRRTTLFRPTLAFDRPLGHEFKVLLEKNYHVYIDIGEARMYSD